MVQVKNNVKTSQIMLILSKRSSSISANIILAIEEYIKMNSQIIVKNVDEHIVNDDDDMSNISLYHRSLLYYIELIPIMCKY